MKKAKKIDKPIGKVVMCPKCGKKLYQISIIKSNFMIEGKQYCERCYLEMYNGL